MAMLLIGGDVCPIGSNQEPFAGGDAGGILKGLKPVFEDADLRIVNLECPFIDEPSPITKIGPVLGVSPECVLGLRAMGIDGVTLANNHIMDHGWPGLRTTLQSCRSVGLATFGAGATLGQAREPFIATLNGVSVAFLGAAAREFGCASVRSPGASPVDLPNLTRDIEALAGEVDHVVVLLHTGLDGYPFPTPEQRKVSRFLVDRGARAVICQHSHRVGCYESYRESLIVYGQGNLLFDWSPSVPDWWNVGCLLTLDLDRYGIRGFEFVPTRSASPGVELLEGPKGRHVLEGMADRSQQIARDGAVDLAFSRECVAREEYYRSGLITSSRLFRKLNRILRLDRLLLRGVYRLWLLNVIRCEQHREVLEKVLSEAEENGLRGESELPGGGGEGKCRSA